MGFICAINDDNVAACLQIVVLFSSFGSMGICGFLVLVAFFEIEHVT